MIPKIGMKFNSEQDTYDFYNAYASNMGFSIQRNDCHYVGTSSTLKTREFTCSRAGI
jgi:zinc finger SWIM domain-containing protein 3